jgi:hypothetical protein
VKRSALILLTLVYLVSCLGIAVNKFYCCGQLKTVSISTIENYVNDVNSSATTEKCCNQTSQTFKVKDQHIASSAVLLQSTPLFAIAHSKLALSELPSLSIKENIKTYYNPPPNPSGNNIYNLFCNYRI